MYKEFEKCDLQRKCWICRVHGAADETVAHNASGCSKLPQKEYQQLRHDNIAKMLHWKLCEKWDFNKAEKWYIHKPEKVLESENCMILQDFPIQTDKTLEHNLPDITVIDKESKKYVLIDLACPFDHLPKNAQPTVSWSIKLQKFVKWKRWKLYRQ